MHSSVRHTIYGLLVGGVILGMSACDRESLESLLPSPEEGPAVLQPDAALSHAAVREHVTGKMRDGRLFSWTEVSDLHVFSAGVREDSLFSWGYWPDVATKGDAAELIGTREFRWDRLPDAVEQVLAKAAEHESNVLGREVAPRELIAFATPDGIPQLTLRLTALASVELLRAHELSRYLEPMGFDPERSVINARSSSGCNIEPDYNLPLTDYTTVTPGVKVPWNYPIHRIPEAWALSQGAGVGIEIIDTGSSDAQENVGSQFGSGQSSGRSLTRLSTHYTGSLWWRSLESPHDRCGHGTQMSGVATGPRGSDGNAVGVAYRANLTIVRAVEDVVITSSNESAGVRDALVLAGNNAGVKIVSMSIGTPFSNGTVGDGIYYAYNRGKLLIAAAGTSFSWTSWYGVIFPATMSQTVAVTGVKEGLPLQRCSSCHDGSEVDFVIQMSRRSDPNRTSLSLATSGDQPTYVGGSSSATATTAGIAALVWSRTPSLSREQVLDRLKQSGSIYPSRSSTFGWGSIDALSAVGNL